MRLRHARRRLGRSSTRKPGGRHSQYVHTEVKKSAEYRDAITLLPLSIRAATTAKQVRPRTGSLAFDYDMIFVIFRWLRRAIIMSSAYGQRPPYETLMALILFPKEYMVAEMPAGQFTRCRWHGEYRPRGEAIFRICY